MVDNNAYVYAILVDGVVRYIGKGRNGRLRDHLWYARRLNDFRATGAKVRATHFYNRLAKALRDRCSIEERVLISGLSDAEAFKLERKEIAECKHSDELWNMTAGGDGFTSEDFKALWQKPEFRQKMLARDYTKFLKASKEARAQSGYKAQLVKRNQDQWNDLQWRELHTTKLVSGWRRKWEGDPAFKQNVTTAAKKMMNARWADQEWRDRQLSRMQSVEFKERQRIAVSGRQYSDEEKKQRSERAKKMWAKVKSEGKSHL